MPLKLRDLLHLSHQILSDIAAPHALIGAFAMSALGVHRATNDIDFLVHGHKRDEARRAFLKHGFQIYHESNEVLQLSGPGQIDLLFANRPTSQDMLARAQTQLFRDIPYLDAADIIGLKIQAYHNDRRRELRDLADIQAIIDTATDLDWARIDRYADAFGVRAQIRALSPKGET